MTTMAEQRRMQRAYRKIRAMKHRKRWADFREPGAQAFRIQWALKQMAKKAQREEGRR